ncbi:MAG: hypothetical protein NT085_00125 [candidate division SR1 bacterium]|nr:hypothetical protein [candidate division SR1 bacterium]
MKKTLVLIAIMMSVFSVFGQGYEYVSLTEPKEFGYILGWIFTFNVFAGGILILPFFGKKIFHLTFIIFLALSVVVGYLIVHYYDLGLEKNIISLFFCSIPGVIVYLYYVVLANTTKHIRVKKSEKKITVWMVIMRYVTAKKLSTFAFPFVFVWTYMWSHTPTQYRKKYWKKLGWNVDSPEVFPKYFILHRTKNPVLTCAVSRSWKHIPISQTRSLGALSLESQHEIELFLNDIKTDISRFYEKDKVLFGEKIIMFGKRNYSPKDMLSRIEKKTPLGIKFLHEHVQKIMEESLHKKKNNGIEIRDISRIFFK